MIEPPIPAPDMQENFNLCYMTTVDEVVLRKVAQKNWTC